MPDVVVTAGIAFMTVVALAVTAVTGVAWWRDRRRRFLLLTVAFGVLSVKGAFVSAGLWSGATATGLLGVGAVFDAVFVGVLYVAIARR